jgi:uncharacterized protein (TIGR02996 family)
MSTQDAFLADICERPDDDAPRLIFADWLDDHGQPERAEFIRAQCHLARPSLRGTGLRRRDLAAREKLFDAHGKEWAASFGPWCAAALDCRRRGFPWWVQQWEGARALCEALPDLVRRAPIQSARVICHGPSLDGVRRLAALPEAARLRELSLFGQTRRDEDMLGDDAAHILAASPHLTRLESLDLTQHHIGPEGLRALANSPNLPELCELDLYNNPVGDAGIRVLLASPMAKRLRGIHLSGGRGDPLTERGVRDLSRAKSLRNLRVLDLDNANVDNVGAWHISRAAHFAGLRELTLHACNVGDHGVICLAYSQHLANLEVLDLSTNWTVGHPSVARALTESLHMKKLRRLDLWRCEHFSPEDVALLRRHFGRKVNFARSR